MTARPLVAVLDYGIGNLRSAQKTLEHVGADARLTADHDVIRRPPASSSPAWAPSARCMQALRRAGLADAARDAAASGRPFLGICIGAADAVRRAPTRAPASPASASSPAASPRSPTACSRPQMQWNRLALAQPDHPLFARLGDEPWMYFVHSFAPAVPAASVLATCEYGGTVTAAVGSGTVAAVQFHPEKSGRDGLALLRGYVDWLAAA